VVEGGMGELLGGRGWGEVMRGGGVEVWSLVILDLGEGQCLKLGDNWARLFNFQQVGWFRVRLRIIYRRFIRILGRKCYL